MKCGGEKSENRENTNKRSYPCDWLTHCRPHCDTNLLEYGNHDHDNCAKSPPEQFIKSQHVVYCVLPLTYIETDKNDATNNLIPNTHRYTYKPHTAVVVMAASNKLEGNILLFLLFPTQHMSESA